LALGQGGAVVLILLAPLLAPDDGQNAPRVGLHHHGGALSHALSARPLHAVANDLLGLGLNVQIEGGRHAQPAAVGAVMPVLLDKLEDGVLCEVWRPVAEEAPGRALLHAQGHLHGAVGLVASDIALAAHLAEHQITALLGRLRVVVRRAALGVVRERGQ